MRSFVTRLLVPALVLLTAPPVDAHGGQYVAPPSDVSGPSATGGGTVGLPGANVGGTGGGPNLPGTSSGARAAGGSRGGSARGGASGGATSGSGSPALESWEFWWESNRDRYLALKQHLYQDVQPSGSAARLTGRGGGRGLGRSERPTPEIVEARIIPTLLELAHAEDQRDILDSTVLALGRSVDPEQADGVRATAVELLGHDELTVQGAAALALGVLDSRSSSELLVHLLADDTVGRQATGGGQVPTLVRSFAALSLGLLGDARSVHVLMSTVRSLPDSERDIKSCVVAALGLVPRDVAAADVVESCLVDLLADEELDPLVRSYVPTSLGKVGTRAVLPELVGPFRSDRTNILVRQSLAIALGQLATLEDEQVIDALAVDVEQGNDQQTRHFALIALGQIAAHPETAGHPGHERLRRLMVREIRGRGRSSSHRSWASLGAALYGLGHAEAAAALLPELRAAFDGERDPSFRGAFAIALGLLDDGTSAPTIHAAFQESRQHDFQGYAGVALGLLRYQPAAKELLELCQDKTIPPTFRLKTATSLGLMGDRLAVPVLIESLASARTLGGLASSARALGLIGDRTALAPLLELATREEARDAARAFACVALGLIGEREELPFNAALKAHNNYRAQTPAIAEVLRIL